MRYFITGGSGFIGSHLIQKLVERGEVTLLMQPGREEELDRNLEPSIREQIQVIKGDISNPDDISQIRTSDVVIHLAAISYIPASVKDPVRTFEVNTRGTLEMLEMARQGNLSRFVFISTGQVYGKPEKLPLTEAHPLNPVSPYAASKAASEMMVNSYNQTYGLPTVILRPVNIYGPRQGPDFVIPTIINQCLKEGAVSLRYGTPVRDFTYVTDAVDFMLLAAHDPKAVGRAFNIGTNTGISIKDLALLIQRYAGVEGEPSFTEDIMRAGDIDRLVVDYTLAKETLGWEPKVSLEDGISNTVKEYRASLKL